MSKKQLEELLAGLSPADRAELKEMLDQPPMTDEELAADPAWRAYEELMAQPPLNLPPDFSVNHNHYIHGAPKVAE